MKNEALRLHKLVMNGESFDLLTAKLFSGTGGGAGR